MWEVRWERDGEACPVRFHAMPGIVTVVPQSGTGSASLALSKQDLLVETEGLGFHLRMVRHFGYGHEERPRRVKVFSSTAHNYSVLDVAVGRLIPDGPPEAIAGRERPRNSDWRVKPEEGTVRARLGVHWIEPHPDRSLPEENDLPEAAAEARADWIDYLAGFPDVARQDPPLLRAIHTLWSALVPAGDSLPVEACLMSKVFMTAVWSWDPCFNAIALSHGRAGAALDQFRLCFAHQAENGVLPDMVGANREIVWGVTKAPVHGWCLSLLRDKGVLGQDDLVWAAKVLEKWTDFWLTYRDGDGDGVPEIPMGCDCLDNATEFDPAFFVESPCLSAFLVVQMDELAVLCAHIGDPAGEERWRLAADGLLARLMEHCWDGERFVAKVSGSHEPVTGNRCLTEVLPLLLGPRLHKPVFDKLVCILERDFRTSHGPATESPASLFYESDGYWRGSIWAPLVLLVVDGLRRGGRDDLARDLASDFCRTVEASEGFDECYDALTGQPQRAPGYTWTAAVYLDLRLRILSGLPACGNSGNN